MTSVTIRRRIAFFSVLGLFAPGCSSDGADETPVLTAGTTGSGTGGQTTAGGPPKAGSTAAGTGSSATGAAGMVATTAGRTGGAGTAAGGSGAPAAGRGGAGASGAGASGTGAATSGSGATAGSPAAPSGEPFSFFVASWAAMQRLSKSPNGFGGDLRYGQPDGLSGADKICTEIAEHAVPGSGAKGWRAFLSVTKGPNGQPVHAIDRIGEGPWYDRLGRLVAMNKANLAMSRPLGADPAIINDLPNEDGVPNHAPDGMQVDNHDILTGTGPTGQLFNSDWRYTCHDWTSSIGGDGTPRVGHSWPRMGGMRPGGGRGAGLAGTSGGAAGTGFVPPTGGGPGGPGGLGDMANWMSSLNEAGCAAGASLVEMGPPDPNNPTVGSGGGYGGIYCFALKP
jgi:hypothetical protein